MQRPEGSPHPRGSAAAGRAGEGRGEHAEVRPEREMGTTGGLGLSLHNWLQGGRAEARLVKVPGHYPGETRWHGPGKVQTW